ncbi:hypothetical protein BD770DRAFT_406027 [Pilaira anomala]|nr:hypothetical protein BD770DRAFT_417007 [Pilaira anomala]KAI9365650.1 hypothetical protein BD770DRAFT_406027 [Pilaira anomala]
MVLNTNLIIVEIVVDIAVDIVVDTKAEIIVVAIAVITFLEEEVVVMIVKITIVVLLVEMLVIIMLIKIYNAMPAKDMDTFKLNARIISDKKNFILWNLKIMIIMILIIPKISIQK